MLMTPEDHRRAFLDLVFPSETRKLSGRYHYRLKEPPKKGPARKHNMKSLDGLMGFEPPTDKHMFISPTLRCAEGDPAVKAGVYASQVVWADIDADGGMTLHEAIDIVSELGVPPSLVVGSGGNPDKGHLYYFFDHPFFVQEDLDGFEALLKRLGATVGGDPNVAHAASLMRLPGTLNVKPEYGDTSPLVKIIEHHADRIYSRDQLEEVLPPLPTRRRKKSRRKVKAAPPPHLSQANAGEIEQQLRACDFIAHCITEAAELPEGLWAHLLWILGHFGEQGEGLAVEWSRPHPEFDLEETLTKIEYGKTKGYAPSCQKLVEDGFECQKYDLVARRCRFFPVARPQDLAKGSRSNGITIRGRETWRRDKNGDHCIAAFIVCIDKEMRSPDGSVLVGRAVTADGRSIPLEFPASFLGDTRALSCMLAGALGGSFICDRQSLDRAWRTWLLEAEIVIENITHDFGFTKSGNVFCDSIESLPPSAPLFVAPSGSPSGRLGLARARGNRELRELTEVVTTYWIRLNGPGSVEFLLGCAGWALIAPVLESRPGVEPLMAWLCGASGRGKTLHCIVAQSLFGAFDDHALVHFGSTALGIEEQSHGFHGALMVVDDIKRSTKSADGFMEFLAFVQRAYGRTPRQKLTRKGMADAGRPCRATLLLNGEDMILTESSALARVLSFELGPQNVDCTAAALLLGATPKLSALTRDLASRLMVNPGWEDRVAERYNVILRRLSQGLSGGANRTRLAKSSAAVLCGLELWLDWFSDSETEHPFCLHRLEATLAGQAQVQMESVDAAKPGERFLALVQVALGSGRFHLQGDGSQVGELAGRIMEGPDEDVVCLCYRTLLPYLRNILEDGESLPPQESIRKSLVEMGAMGTRNTSRGTRAVRLRGRVRATWPIRRVFIFPDENE